MLYQARIALPSNVTTGRYTAETFAINRGRVVASAISDVEVKKVGFERAVAAFAQGWGFFYGCHRGRLVGLHGLVRGAGLLVRLGPPHAFGDPILTTAGYARRR